MAGFAAASLAAWIAMQTPPGTAPAATAPPTPLPTATPAPLQTSMLIVPGSWHVESTHLRNENAAFRRLGAWASADGSEEIALDVAPSFGYGFEAISQRVAGAMSRAVGSAALRESGTVRLCRGQQGWKEIYDGSGGSGITFVFAASRWRVYVATYRFAHSGGSPEGEAAAESLCPPPDPAVHLPLPPVDPPAGWVTSAGIENAPLSPNVVDWAWTIRPHGGPEQRFIAMRFPVPKRGGLSYALSATVTRSASGRAIVLRRQPVELCRATDAVFVAMLIDSPRGPTQLESIVTIAGGHAYAAIYVRLVSAAVRPEAERALRSLCPARDSRNL
jgi:hypothetical protein